MNGFVVVLGHASFFGDDKILFLNGDLIAEVQRLARESLGFVAISQGREGCAQLGVRQGKIWVFLGGGLKLLNGVQVLSLAASCRPSL